MTRLASKDVAQLKAHLARLALLDGTPVRLTEGLHLVWAERVLNAPALVAACRRNALTVASLRAWTRLQRDPVAVTGSWLAAAQRDLRLLMSSRYRRQLAREARPLRRIARIDEHWIAERQRRIDVLSTRLHGPARAPAPAALHPTVLDLTAAVHGDEGATALSAVLARSIEALRGADPKHLETDFGRRLLIRLVELAETWGVAFRATASDVLSVHDVERAADDAAHAVLVGCALPLRVALDLAPLRSRTDHLVFFRLTRLVERGLPLGDALAAERLGMASDLADIGDPVVAHAWCAWSARLVPEHRASGVDLRLRPEAFERAAAGRGAELAALAECLAAHRGATRIAPERRLAALDAVLGLFCHAPQEARGLTAAPHGTAHGEGRRAFPAFASWLHDDALLDRLVHLQRLAGHEPSLSRRLLSDFEGSQRVKSQIAHLAGLPSPSVEQTSRLVRLRERAVAGGGRSSERTRRRLQEAVETAREPAFLHQLDRALRAVLRRAFGVAPERLDEAWLAAVRFQSMAAANRDHLGQVVRHAAARPGEPIHRALPANRRWLDCAARHLDADAWLAHREHKLVIGGRRYHLATEEDPLQVLRMGIPFDTCLALERGPNAAACILNAVDANKRVLYLRNARGAIVARKLIAISSDWKLVNYRLYSALNPEAGLEVEHGFRALCEEIAAAVRVPLAASGVPERIQTGFWYDDGTVPFDGEGEAERLYCEHLGVPLVRTTALRHEAEGWLAQRRGDVEGALASLPSCPSGPAQDALADWIVSKLPPDEGVCRAAECPSLSLALFRRAAATSTGAVLDLFRRLRGTDLAWWGAEPWIASLPPAPGLASAVVRTARSWTGRRLYVGTIEAFVVPELPLLASAEHPRDLLALCDAVEPILNAAADGDGGAAEHLASTRDRLLLSAELAYDARPDLRAVTDCLASRRRTGLARAVALHLAGRFSLAHGLPVPGPDPLAALRDAAADEAAVSEAVRELASDRTDVLLATLGIRLLGRSGRDLGVYHALRALAARSGLPPEAVIALWSCPALRDPVARNLAGRISECELRRHRAVAAKVGLDGDALVRSVIRAALDRTDLGWVRDFSSLPLLREVMDVALGSTPSIAVGVLSELPDALSAASFAPEIAERFGAAALGNVSVPDREGGRQRERWLRYFSGTGSGR